MTFTGHKDAVDNAQKYLIGSKEDPYPTRSEMVQSAALNFSINMESFIKSLAQLTY